MTFDTFKFLIDVDGYISKFKLSGNKSPTRIAKSSVTSSSHLNYFIS